MGLLGLRRQLAPVFLLLIASSILVTESARAAGTVTDCSNDSQLNAMLSGGGTVDFNCGTATIDISSTKTISQDTTVDGGGLITLYGMNSRHIFDVSDGATLTLKNIVLTNGYGHFVDGGAIDNHGHLVLDTVTVKDSQADLGGGGIVTYGPLDVKNSTLTGNRAYNGGAIYARLGNAQVTIVDSLFSYNTADDDPNNAVDGRGGAFMLSDGASLTGTGSEFRDNTAHDGGAIYTVPSNSTVSLANTAIYDNTLKGTTSAAEYGGGIYNGGTLNLMGGGNGSGIFGNSMESGLGGGIFNAGTATISGYLVFGNGAGGGAGIYSTEDITIRGSIVEGNNGTGDGGGLYLSGNATLEGTTVNNNGANGGYGGGIYGGAGTLTITNSTISQNSISTSPFSAKGGGLRANGTTTITNTTFADNSAYGYQGEPDPGSAIYSSAAINLRNVIVTGSNSTNCVFEAPPIEDSNLSNDDSCAFGPGRDNVDVMLGPLLDNGVFTPTHIPEPNSPAIDGGTLIGCPDVDQRGQHRPVGASCDVGSIEVTASTPTPSPSPSPSPTPTVGPSHSPTPSPTAASSRKQGDLDCDGSVSPRDALLPMFHEVSLSLVSRTLPCPALTDVFGNRMFGDVNCSGAIDGLDTLVILASVAEVPFSVPAGCKKIGQSLS